MHWLEHLLPSRRLGAHHLVMSRGRPKFRRCKAAMTMGFASSPHLVCSVRVAVWRRRLPPWEEGCRPFPVVARLCWWGPAVMRGPPAFFWWRRPGRCVPLFRRLVFACCLRRSTAYPSQVLRLVSERGRPLFWTAFCANTFLGSKFRWPCSGDRNSVVFRPAWRTSALPSRAARKRTSSEVGVVPV